MTAPLSASRLRKARTVPTVLLAACVAMALAACASGPSIQPPSGHHVTVNKSATALPGPSYAWFEMPKVLDAEKDARVENPQFRAGLQAALDRAMQEKGYRLEPDMARADFLLAWRAGVRNLQQASLKHNRDEEVLATPEAAIECGAGGCSQLVTRGPGGAPVAKVRSIEYVEGGLLVEAIEPKTAHLLWSGFNRGTVVEGDRSQAGLEAIARETMAQLPAR